MSKCIKKIAAVILAAVLAVPCITVNATNHSSVMLEDITAKKVTPAVSLSRTTYVYDGKEKKPTVTVKDGKTVIKPTNYTVTYAPGRKEVGIYKVTVTLKGAYTGKIPQPSRSSLKTCRSNLFRQERTTRRLR